MALKFFAAAAATAALALSASAAGATTFAGHWYLEGLKTSDPGLVLTASAYTGTFSADLGPNNPSTSNNEEIAVIPLFSLYTTENSIDGDDIFFTGTATLRFDFDVSPLPNSGPTSITGVTGGLVIPFLFKGGYLDWNPGSLLDTNGKMVLNYGPVNDGVMSIYVNGGTYNGSNKQLSVSASFDWDHDATVLTSAAPEPATWALMIGGFGLAGAALRRRRSLAVA